MKARFFLLPLLCLAGMLFGASAPALAQSGKTVVVQQRDGEITILQNGDARFVETWVVEFQRGSFTFAFREIPKNNLRDITAVSVTEGTDTLKTQIDDTDSKTKITWYFPPTNRGADFFSDTHTFTLRYTVQGAMRIYPEGDQFWWKFVEKDRAYEIQSARARVHLPASFSPEQLKGTTYLNSRESGGARVIDGQTVEYIGGPFPPQTEWEIRAQFPHTIQAEPEEWQKSDDRAAQIAAQNNFYAVLAGVVLSIGGPLLLLMLWYLLGRDKPTTWSAEFLNAPPDDTPPGVVGTLLDERADLADIVATVADLAQRGYLRIREGDAFGTPEYERTEKSDAGLAPFEKTTLDALLRGMTMRRLDDVRGSFYERIKELESALYAEVVARGYFPKSPLSTRDFYFGVGKIGALLVPTAGLCAYCVTFARAPLALFPLFALEILFISLIGLSRAMPQRTPGGATAFAKWSAFKRYLASVERYAHVNEAQDQFSRYLPYAIAFGLEKSWIEKFKQTTVPAPQWYIPYVPDNLPRDDGWSWSKVGEERDGDELRGADERPSSSGGSLFRPDTVSTNANTPIFSDRGDEGGASLPSLNKVADNSFTALNRVSGNMFDFLNTSAEAFTTKPPTRSSTDEFLETVGGVLNWIVSSSGGHSSSSSSSRSSSSSSDASSSSDWSGGGSSGGGGGGGGSSGFG